MAKKKQAGTDESDLVSFRLDADFRKLLQEGAASHGQPKANLFARTLVQRALTNASDSEVKHELAAIRSDLRKVREDIATVAFVLLVKLGKEDAEKAKAWVRETLNR